MTDGRDLRELRALAARQAQLQQADILIYQGELPPPGDGSLALPRHDRPRRPNCLLILTTSGGWADTAYRLTRMLRRLYGRLIVYVDDYCKGAGMLLAVAADELVISDFGELGPLDIVSQHASIPGHGESAPALVHGHEARSVNAAAPLSSYVQRLAGDHLEDGSLERLLTGYPSFDFVIDREEASAMIRTVRGPSAEEGEFLMHVEPIVNERRLQGRLLLLEEALAIVTSAWHRNALAAPAGSPDLSVTAGQCAVPEHAASPDRLSS